MLSFIEKSRFFNAQQYLRASKNLLGEMLTRNNPCFFISDHEISEKELSEHLKYSSNNIILPSMFCFYQGLELIIKGFVLIKEPSSKDKHEAEKLYKKFKIYYPSNDTFSDLFNIYLNEPPAFIQEYKNSNNIQKVNKLYNSFRYPDEVENHLCDYSSLNHPNNDNFLPQLEKLLKDIDLILKYSVSLFRELDN